MSSTKNTRRWFSLMGLGICALLITPLAVVPAWAQNPDASSKRTRQIGVMEGIIDQVLRDSPNILVWGSDNTHGLYLDEFGAIFTFEASLTGRGSVLSMVEPMRILSGKHFSVKRGQDGEVSAFSWDDDDDSTDDQGEEATPPPSKKSAKSKIKEIREKAEAKEEDQAALYKKGKAEIVQVLLDYGDTMTSLRDDQSLALAAFLRGSDFLIDNRISRLIVKARMKDLRDFSAGRISETEMKARFIEEEY